MSGERYMPDRTVPRVELQGSFFPGFGLVQHSNCFMNQAGFMNEWLSEFDVEEHDVPRALNPTPSNICG